MLLVPAGGARTTHPLRACGRRLRSSADSLVNNQWLFVCSPAAACSRLGPGDAAITASSSSRSSLVCSRPSHLPASSPAKFTESVGAMQNLQSRQHQQLPQRQVSIQYSN